MTCLIQINLNSCFLFWGFFFYIHLLHNGFELVWNTQHIVTCNVCDNKFEIPQRNKKNKCFISKLVLLLNQRNKLVNSQKLLIQSNKETKM